MQSEQYQFLEWAEQNKARLLERWPEFANPDVAEQFRKDAIEILPLYDLHLAEVWNYQIVLMVRDLIAFHQDRKEAA